MLEVYGDLWHYPADIRIITTNGTINRKGQAVMGRGCAKEATERFPDIQKRLGANIRLEGNRPFLFPDLNLATFPVKHNWWERANLPLIRASALQLVTMLNPDLTYVMVRPGCGNGGREWDEVKPLLDCLPDNVHVITWESTVDAK